jgi:hypothetical protein
MNASLNQQDRHNAELLLLQLKASEERVCSGITDSDAMDRPAST